MTNRLLLVESSATMRQVLTEHLATQGYDVDDTSRHADAVERLDRRFEAFHGDYAGVIVGWPAATDAVVEALVNRLERDDLIDMPVVVMSTDQRAATRAWVASRDRTAMLVWKRYRDIAGLLSQLLMRGADGRTAYLTIPSRDAGADGGAHGGPAGEVRGDGAAPPAGARPATVMDAVQVGVRDASGAPKFDNADIHLLLVDDSATIRRSLQDLFGLHGYTVSLAAGHEEALKMARRQRFDVAVVDFYLDDGTGDRVCRDLVDDPDTGDVVCAVLTGSYSDHIIRRSLRAGALECLFKNESSELLLNRIDALSRFVRQRRRLDDERRLMDQVFDVVAGAALVIDDDDGIRHVSRDALQLLGQPSSQALEGVPVIDVIGAGSQPVPPADGEMHRRTFMAADGQALDMLVERRPLNRNMGSVMQFALVEAEADEAGTDAPAPSEPEGVAETTGMGGVVFHRRDAGTPATAEPLMALLDRCLSGREPLRAQASLLVLGIWSIESDGRAVPLRARPRLAEVLAPHVSSLYRREDHLADLGDGRYGFVLRHRDEPQSWLLTRKLMQLIDEADGAAGAGQRLATSGVLKLLVPGNESAASLVEHCLDMLVRVEARGLDQALLLSPRRILSVYPAASRGS